MSGIRVDGARFLRRPSGRVPFTSRHLTLRTWALILCALALVITVVIVDAITTRRIDNADDGYTVDLSELPAITTTVPVSAVTIDAEAVVELNSLLQAFIPIAQTHGITFDDELLYQLRRESERLGIQSPVSVSFEDGSAVYDWGTGLTQVYLPDEANAIAEELTGAAQAWVTTLAEAPAITRTPLGGAEVLAGRAGFAPASRSGARAGQAVTTMAVRELSAEMDNWLSAEAQAARDAAIARIANLRARMVALSRNAGNGRLPTEALCPIPFSPRFTMRCDVIDSLVELNNAFRAHFGRDVAVLSGYRGNPGTSNHGWGLAIDFGGQMTNFGTSEFNWMNTHARDYGWGHAFWAVPGGLNPQPWHWEAMDEVREMTGRWR